MHKKVVRRKSKVVMEILDQKKEVQLQQQQQEANNNLITVEVNTVITDTSKADGDEEKISSIEKMKGCRNKAKRGRRYSLQSFHELPEYMKDNEFIVNYYRADWPLKEAFFSLFHWHNETLNIWT